jgi:uncharacterized membrane protein
MQFIKVHIEKLAAALGKSASVIVAALLLGFYLGLPLKWIVGISLLLVCACASSISRSHSVLQSESSAADRRSTQVLLLLLATYPVLVFLVQCARQANGNQGLDFAIFSQVVEQVRVQGSMRSSLLDGQWHNFLSHHFSPYLFAVGLLSRILGSAQYTLLFLHSLALAAILWLAFTIARAVNLDRGSAVLLACCVIISPAARVSLLWEVRDEIFALPLLLAALLSWLRKRDRLAVGFLVCSWCFKETMLIASSSFCLMALATYWRDGDKRRKPGRDLYLLCLGMGTLGFILYSKVLAGWMFIPTFSAAARVSNVPQLFDLDLLRQKFWWFATILIPCLPLLTIGVVSALRTQGGFTRYCLCLGCFLLPAAPFVAIILVSNFSGMFHPLNYYSVVPALLLLLGIFLSLPAVEGSATRTALALTCMLAGAIGPPSDIPNELQQAIVQESPVTPLRALIAPSAIVLAGDWDASFFVQQERVMRLYHANRNIMKFDFIVQRKFPPHESRSIKLSAYLRGWSTPCYEDQFWLVRCAYPGARPQSPTQ